MRSYLYHSRNTNETVTIPGAVDAESIDASYHNGVLEVSLPTLDDDVDGGRVIDLRWPRPHDPLTVAPGIIDESRTDPGPDDRPLTETSRPIKFC